MSTLIERIDQLKLLNQTLHEENVQLKSEVESKNTIIAKMDKLIIAQKEAFDTTVTLNQVSFQEILSQQAAETKQLIDATVANESTILENNSKTLDALKDLQTRCDKLRTEYNNYIKANM